MFNAVLATVASRMPTLSLRRDTRGVTALEYGLIAALIAVVIITSVTALGTALSATFATITAAI